MLCYMLIFTIIEPRHRFINGVDVTNASNPCLAMLIRAPIRLSSQGIPYISSGSSSILEGYSRIEQNSE